MALGPRDTTSLVMLTGWDAIELKKFQLQDGTTFDAIVAQMNAVLGALNGELYNDPLFASLLSYTDQAEVEYAVGSSNGFGEYTEYGRPDAQRGATEGHMLPLKSFDRGLGWTWDYLRKARAAKIQADIADAAKDARDLWRKAILTRILQRGDDSGAAKGLGASGLSAGFATTAASTGVDFVPPAYGGNVFTSTHEHYITIAGGAWTTGQISDIKAELLEHGHEPPYTCLVSPLDTVEIEALTGFVPVARMDVNYASTVSLASFGPQYSSSGYNLGTYSDVLFRVTYGMPTDYGFGFKSYGMNSQRNPLRIRLQKGQTRPQIVAMPDPRSGGSGAYPLQFMMLFTELGVGVADRTAGTPRYNNHANTWADGVAA